MSMQAKPRSKKLRGSRNGYEGLILQAKGLGMKRLMIGVPTTGLIRFEWASARYNQIIPCNWSHSECSPVLPQSINPVGFLVAEARNIIVNDFIKRGAEWLFFIDHDVIIPHDCFVRINEWINDYGDKYPVICGLYFAKASSPEPLIYRGRGNSYFKDWRVGDKVMVDGIHMGCTLIHRSLLEAMWKDAPEYVIPGAGVIRRVFDTPAGVFNDPETGIPHGFSGTEDLAWCNRIIAGNYLKKAGFPKLQREKYPFMCDTGMFCHHITEAGQRYPLYVPKRHEPLPKKKAPRGQRHPD